jgi:hydrogenase maturation protease
MGANDPVLILGIGNVLMGDEGVGVHVARHLEARSLPEGVVCLDGGTGGFQLLGAMECASRVVIIDATMDGSHAGTVRRLRPRYSNDYPRTLTAHDIGLKDLLDTFYLIGERPDVTLFAVSIANPPRLGVELSEEIAAHVPLIAAQALEEALVGSPSD